MTMTSAFHKHSAFHSNLHRGLGVTLAVFQRNLKISTLSLVTLLTACQQRTFNQSETLDTELDAVEPVNFDRQQLLSKHRFERITPTGEKIFAAARAWEKLQEAQASVYAQPFQSANNVSRVLEMAGLPDYSAPQVWALIDSIKRRGGMVIQFPKDSRFSARIIEDHFEGALPVGTLISACVSGSCAGAPEEMHLSLVGSVDSAHNLQLWHNNWFRPENRLWRKYMIPLAWYQAGFPRKWMSTPWLSQIHNSQGKLDDLRGVVPELIELDPSTSLLTAIIVPEILKELREYQAVMTDGLGAVMPFRARSVSRRAEPVELPPVSETSGCNTLKVVSQMPTNLRASARGKMLCQIGQGTQVDLVSQEKNWSRVRAVCPDGQRLEGYVLSALIVSACGK